MKPLVVLGCIRSGTTVLHELLLAACPNAVDLTEDDFESRFFWQHLGVKIGSRSTGTYCCPAGENEVGKEEIVKVQDYLAYRGRGGRAVITKNPHLLNKIGFAAKLLPEARFVLIVRDPMSVIASTKLLFQQDHTENEDYPPFVHYWPEEILPCWWTLQDDRVRGGLTKGLLRRKAKAFCYTVGLKKRRMLTAPGKIYRHERLSIFLPEHPDLSRYYPGDGFARIPEAWLTLNVNACRELTKLHSDRWLAITYTDLVSDPRKTIATICDFAAVQAKRLSSVPPRLDETRGNKWRSDLNVEEQERVLDYFQAAGRNDCELLSKMGLLEPLKR